MPERLSFEEAASVPLVGLTAYQSLGAPRSASARAARPDQRLLRWCRFDRSSTRQSARRFRRGCLQRNESKCGAPSRLP